MCDLLILEEPTTGVDVGSKAEIYALMQKSQAEGMAVLLVSSDFEEVAKVCHRALVFDRGQGGRRNSPFRTDRFAPDGPGRRCATPWRPLS